jgi:crotonobetainyl-CoA:carnitine CoA-transferase CaiB-like acyl-CoA transferase
VKHCFLLPITRYFPIGERIDELPLGNDHVMVAPYGTFKTKDGCMNVAVGNQAM